jgi:hypothetical protein
VIFAGTMLAIVGNLNFIAGIAAIGSRGAPWLGVGLVGINAVARDLRARDLCGPRDRPISVGNQQASQAGILGTS